MQHLVQSMKPVQVYNYMFGPTRSFFLGVGFAYAIEKEAYHHLPISFLFPSAYIGYQTYTNRKAILDQL